jgi:hypothetical protein
MDSNLLKEAIADAKAVRQTALANAKVALEEAFSEKYHAMFAEKLKEEAAMDETHPHAEEDEGMKSQENVSEQEIDELIKELEAEVGEPGVPHTEPGEEVPHVDVPVAGAPGAAPVPGAFPGAVPPGCPTMPAAPGVAPVPPMAPPVAGVPGAEMGAVPPMAPPSDVPPVSGEEADEDVDLNELLESLKEEIEDEEEEEGKKLDEMKKLDSSAIAPGGNKKPSAVASSSSDIESGGMKHHGLPNSEQTSGEDPTDVTKPDKNWDGNKGGNLAKHGPLKEDIKNHGLPGGEQTSGEDPTDVTKPDKNWDGNKDGNLAKTPHIHEVVKENETLKKQLGEAYETITYVKGQLNEINLLNAKLLYTNKLFKEYNMSNEQKMRVVEMFDLSKNVREVKLTYANIAESLNFSGSDMRRKVTNSNSSVQSITEGLASKPVGSTKPSREIISESKSAMVSKFQKLAGIQKK